MASPYSNIQQFNPLASIQDGMNMRQMIDKNRMAQQQQADDSAINNLYRDSTTTNEDGTQTLDRQKLLSGMTNVNPQRSMQQDQLFKEQDQAVKDRDYKNQQNKMESGLKQADLISRAASAAKDQPSYEQSLGFLKNAGVDVSQLPRQYDPQLVKRYEMMAYSAKERLQEQMKTRELDIKEKEVGAKHEENRNNRDRINGEHVDKLAKDFKKDLDPDVSRAGNFGQISAKYQAGERMKTLVGAFKDQNLPPAQVEELALGLANMVSGSNGGAARAQVEALVPHSLVGDSQKVKAWLLNEPYGANQQKFVEMMSHTIDREMDTAQNQLNGIRVKRLSTHSRFKNAAPEQYNQMLSDYGIDPKLVKDGKYLAPPPSGTVQMRDPKGNIRAVPADQVEAAKAAGGTEL